MSAGKWATLIGSVVLVVAALSMGGCSADAGYVAADRATFDQISPAHRAYVEADPSLSGKQKTRRGALLDAWGARLSEGESE